MDVTTPERAKIAEAARRCRSNGVERFPDIRAHGGSPECPIGPNHSIIKL